MVRTQIQLTPEQAQAAKRIAAERGVSMAEVIRQALDRYASETSPGPDRGELVRRALAAAGAVKAGPSDLSARHDDYLAEAYESP